MKKFWFLLSFSLLFVLVWCQKQEIVQESQPIQEEIAETKHVVRNVDRWMTIDEVKKAENIKESDITDIFDDGWVQWLETTTYLNWEKFYLLYAFYDWKLWYVMYWLDDAKFSDYWTFRQILWQKYWNWEDITDEEYNDAKTKSDAVLKEINDAQEKTQNCIDWKIQCSKEELDQAVQLWKDKLKELEDPQKIFSKYMFDDDQVWKWTKPNYEYDKDLQITLWDLQYKHTRELDDWTFISIELRTWIESYWATLVISYISNETKELLQWMYQSEIDNNL